MRRLIVSSQLFLRSLVRSAKRGNGDTLCGLIDRYAQAYTSKVPGTAEHASLLLIDSIVQCASVAGQVLDLPETVIYYLTLLQLPCSMCRQATCIVSTDV